MTKRNHIRKYAAWTLLCGSAGILSAQQPDAVWNVRDHVPLHEVIVQAHRGAGMQMPESSMEAFEIAWKMGAVPEADVRTTRDGVIVSFHDGNFARVLPDAPETMKNKGIQDLTCEEVMKLDIGAWRGMQFRGQRVLSLATLVEALKAHPERRVYIDLKNVDLVQLAEETESIHSQLIIASSRYDELKRWKEVAPQSHTLCWMGGSETELAERLDRLETERFRFIDQLQIHVHVDGHGTLSPGEDFLRRTGTRLRKYNILYQTFPWESQDVTVFRRLMDLGVASFATDYPEITLQAIADYYAH
ncbi:MAG: hypothetical protein LBB90_09110 [Tannerella sp.]|jgi:glycerophosphoryl diester phosphodiesterase|nr:hypothetical protein [Tannerella sp.]